MYGAVSAQSADIHPPLEAYIAQSIVVPWGSFGSQLYDVRKLPKYIYVLKYVLATLRPKIIDEWRKCGWLKDTPTYFEMGGVAIASLDPSPGSYACALNKDCGGQATNWATVKVNVCKKLYKTAGKFKKCRNHDSF